MASICDPELAELAEKLFPGCHVPGVVDSFLRTNPKMHLDCARYNMDQKERMVLFVRVAARVAELHGIEIDVGVGMEHVRDPQARCELFTYGGAAGDCQTDGHYLCAECKERDPKLIRDPSSVFYVPPMERRKHKGKW